MKHLLQWTAGKRMVVCALLLVLAGSLHAQRLLLNGNWNVKLETGQQTPQIIQLPGTLDDAGIGEPVTGTPRVDIATMAHLTRKFNYVGKAYYTRTVKVPANWKGKRLVLTLGRVLWKSQLCIDGVWLNGSEESLVISHSYHVTGKLLPGKTHTITVMVDNSSLYPGINIYERKYPNKDSYEMVHAYTNHTQVKWNGILGDIQLQATPLSFIEQVDVTPLVKEQKLAVQYAIQQRGKAAGKVFSYVTEVKTGRRWKHVVSGTAKNGKLEVRLNFDKEAKPWNEFTPQLYQLVSVLVYGNNRDTVVTPFGIRDLAAKDRNLYLNNQRVFMRGNLECVIFPLTGYPPMDKQTWVNLYAKAKSFGLNSFRFHSWCPPQAAFEAADETGFYLQVELPHWNLKVGTDTAAFAYLRREAYRILAQYGNHPSFMFFSMGNELEGNFALLNNLVHELKAVDKRHLYTTTTFSFQKDVSGIVQPEDDFLVTQWTKDGWVRGQGVFNDKAPDFSKDYSAAAGNIAVPLISHEIGQYSVYPDVAEIAAYTGNLVPNNLIAVKNDLEKKGRLWLAPAYLNASGKLATLLYKEEIERALKTKEFDGLQLLQLQDFPGQGTALVGVLNAFWSSKGFVTAEQFRSFNSELVPLIRFARATWLNNEHFTASVELANFYSPLQQAVVNWNVRTEDGKTISAGAFDKKYYGVGNRLEVGQMDVALQNITTATRLIVEVGVTGTQYRNQWSIWVYPAAAEATADSIVVTQSFAAAESALMEGKTVLLSPAIADIKGTEGRFTPVFWSPVHFPDQPGTMGQLIKAAHPALKAFPTTEHTDWQWWDLIKKSKTPEVDSLPDEAVIVRVIDNFVTNRNLCALWEVKVGKGKLLFSGMDVLTDRANRPAARQLYNSLLGYMKGPQFNPQVAVPLAWVKGVAARQ